MLYKREVFYLLKTYQEIYILKNRKRVNICKCAMDYNKAIKLNPKLAQAYLNRGFAKAKLGDYKGAIEDYNKGIKINPKYAGAYFWRGLIKLDMGQKDSGCLDLSKARELGHSGAYQRIKEYCN